MKKNLLLGLLASIGLFSFTFAANGNTRKPLIQPKAKVDNVAKKTFEKLKETQKKIKQFDAKNLKELRQVRTEKLGEIIENWGEFHKEYGKIKTYLKKDLTDEEKAEILEMINIQKEGMRQIAYDYRAEYLSGNYEDIDALYEEMANEMIELTMAHLQDLEAYVEENFLDEFQNLEEDFAKMLAENKIFRLEIKQKKYEVKKEVKTHKAVLVGNLKNGFQNKLEKIPDEKKEKFYTKLLQKVEMMYNNIDNSNMNVKNKVQILKALDEIYDMVEGMLNNMYNEDVVQEDEVLIEEVLDIDYDEEAYYENDLDDDSDDDDLDDDSDDDDSDDDGSDDDDSDDDGSDDDDSDDDGSDDDDSDDDGSDDDDSDDDGSDDDDSDDDGSDDDDSDDDGSDDDDSDDDGSDDDGSDNDNADTGTGSIVE